MTDEQTIEGAVEIETGITPREDGTLEVFYRVTNDLDATILLLTPLSNLVKNVVCPVPERVYAYVDPDGVLHVTKRLWPLPDAVDVFFPEVPFATEVRAGKTFEETLRLRLPIEVDYPYRSTAGDDAENKKGEVATAQGFAFSIGYLIEIGGLCARDRIARKRRTCSSGDMGRRCVIKGYCRANYCGWEYPFGIRRE